MQHSSKCVWTLKAKKKKKKPLTVVPSSRSVQSSSRLLFLTLSFSLCLSATEFWTTICASHSWLPPSLPVKPVSFLKMPVLLIIDLLQSWKHSFSLKAATKKKKEWLFLWAINMTYTKRDILLHCQLPSLMIILLLKGKYVAWVC